MTNFSPSALDFPRRPDGLPLCIGHRGASGSATENTLAAFRAASELGAEMWELDVRLTADGVAVVSHDANLLHVFGKHGTIAELTRAELAEIEPDVPSFDDVIALAVELGTALYVELKARGAGPAVVAALTSAKFTRAAIGSFDPTDVAELAEAGCRYPLSVLVRLNDDPFIQAKLAKAGTIHLCWEKGGARPQDLVTPEIFARAKELGLGIVLWHEERASILADLMAMPVLGICTDKPEMMRGFAFQPKTTIQTCYHRGANHFAPENTLAAARLAFEQGASFVELDVRTSADGQIMVMHDARVDRTTNGTGILAEMSSDALRALDAGSWFSRRHKGEKIPTLAEMIALAKEFGGKLYIENKDVDPTALVAEVARLGFLDQCFYWSFSAEFRQAMLAADPGALVKGNWSTATGRCEAAETRAFGLTEILFKDYIAQAPLAEAQGLVPMMQYFGDDPEVWDEIVRIAPPMLNLDRADLLLAALARTRRV